MIEALNNSRHPSEVHIDISLESRSLQRLGVVRQDCLGILEFRTNLGVQVDWCLLSYSCLEGINSILLLREVFYQCLSLSEKTSKSLNV